MAGLCVAEPYSDSNLTYSERGTSRPVLVQFELDSFSY